jgi:hypothetical protein
MAIDFPPQAGRQPRFRKIRGSSGQRAHRRASGPRLLPSKQWPIQAGGLARSICFTTRSLSRRTTIFIPPEFLVESNLSVVLELLISETSDGGACSDFVRNFLHGTFRMHTAPSLWIEFDVAGEQVVMDSCQPSLDQTIPKNEIWSWFVVSLDAFGNTLELSNASYGHVGFADYVFHRTR